MPQCLRWPRTLQVHVLSSQVAKVERPPVVLNNAWCTGDCFILVTASLVRRDASELVFTNNCGTTRLYICHAAHTQPQRTASNRAGYRPTSTVAKVKLSRKWLGLCSVGGRYAKCGATAVDVRASHTLETRCGSREARRAHRWLGGPSKQARRRRTLYPYKKNTQ